MTGAGANAVTLRAVSEMTYRAAHAHGVIWQAGGRKVGPRATGETIVGHQTKGGSTDADVQEFRTGDGTLIARKVAALGRVQCWLLADLLPLVLAAIKDAETENDRIRADVIAYAEQTRPTGGTAPVPALSVPLLHAGMRHSARLGRLHDLTPRGAKTREWYSRALKKAREQGEN